MKQRALQYLACPTCASELHLTEGSRDGDDIMEGELRCERCMVAYPITRGIPRFAGDIGEIEAKTAQAFGYEWTHYSELATRYRQQFLDWLKPVEPEFFRDKIVLEGGCGKGRHTAVACELGVRDIVSMDLSEAVESAFENTRNFPNAHIVQADLNRPPVKPVFNYAFSIGVLHHLPDPERGFRALVGKLMRGGAVSAWVYGREGNGWIVHIVTPLRERFTSNMSHKALDVLSGVLTVPLFVATKLVYGPARSASMRGLPYGEYLGYISRFPFREQRSIVFDHLVAPVAYYLRRDEFAAWFESAGLEQVVIQPHNANSWRGFARVPEA